MEKLDKTKTITRVIYRVYKEDMLKFRHKMLTQGISQSAWLRRKILEEISDSEPENNSENNS